MKIFDTAFQEVKKFRTEVYSDNRGYFTETFNQREFNKLTGTNYSFVQDNVSFSKMGVIRGLHMQAAPNAQGKLIRVMQGEIFDVVVDMREETKTFKMWTGEYLSAANQFQLWVPPGFAHGFLVVSEEALVSYKTTAFYEPASEVVIPWNDMSININWPLKNSPILSQKDSN